MKKITKEELNEILEEHKKWLSGDGGEQADLSNIDLSDSDLSAANLSGANLSDANFRWADLSRADLTGADLSRAKLSCANLSDSDLSGANLSDSDLSAASLSGANLSDANFRWANLSGVNFRWVDLGGAKLEWTDTEGIKGQNVISVQVNTSRPNNKISYWEDLGIWTTGCFQGTLEELKENIKRTHKDNEFLYDRYQRAIEYILKESKYENSLNKRPNNCA